MAVLLKPHMDCGFFVPMAKMSFELNVNQFYAQSPPHESPLETAAKYEILGRH